MVVDPITRNMIHTVGSIFLNNTDLYCWEDSLKTGEVLSEKIQEGTHAWGNLLIATGGCLKPKNRFWYLLDYNGLEGVWEPAKTAGCKLWIPSDTGSPAPILSPGSHKPKKILEVKDCPARGNKPHLEHIEDKVNAWINTIRNGHLTSSMGWIAYKLQLWPRVRCGIGNTTNDPKRSEKVIEKTDHRMLNILGIASTVKKGWWRMRLTFGRFVIVSFDTKQLIEKNLSCWFGTTAQVRLWARNWMYQ